MSDEDMSEVDRAIAREERREQRARQLGSDNPRCVGCGERDPLALTGIAPEIRCYECQALADGRPATEGHHVAGRRNDRDDIVSLLGNDHRVLSEWQARWPRETLRNPDGSPLLKMAAALRGWLDMLRLVMERTVGWIPRALELLDAFLRENLGDGWWDKIDWGMT